MRPDFPFVPDDLLRALEKAFPDRLPRDPLTPPSEVTARMGEQRVLDFLRSRLTLQQRPERSL
jgi:hypothetical protein